MSARQIGMLFLITLPTIGEANSFARSACVPEVGVKHERFRYLDGEIRIASNTSSAPFLTEVIDCDTGSRFFLNDFKGFDWSVVRQDLAEQDTPSIEMVVASIARQIPLSEPDIENVEVAESCVCSHGIFR